MYKILIVDDEVLIRKRIRYGFDWEAEGFIVAGEAENGQNALTLLEQEEFELAIIDIAMPVMDGIELVRRIRNEGINVEIIFLTGHSEFEYARVALKERVFAYALKPLNEEEFIATIRSLGEKMNAEKRKEQELRLLQSKRKKMEFMLENQQMLEMLYYPGEKEWVQKPGFSQWLKWRLAVIRIRAFRGGFDDYLAFAQTLKELIQLEDDGCVYVYFDMRENTFFLLLNGKELLQKDKCLSYMEHFQRLVAQRIKRRVKVGISSQMQNPDQLHMAYQQSIRCVQNCLINGKDVNIFEDLQETVLHKYILPVDYIRDLKMAIETNEGRSADKTLQKVFWEMKERGVEYQETLRIGEQIISILSEITVKQKQDIKVVMGDYYTVAAAYSYMENYAEIPVWFQSITANILKTCAENQNRKYKNEVALQAKAYVKEHYMEQELSVKTLAQHLFVTDTYLSASFKKSMGISLVQYITQCRLEKARELLRGGDQEVSKVALMVGYSDEYYFSRCFKKYFGISPFYDKKNQVIENEL